jgi:hypothetical protein
MHGREGRGRWRKLHLHGWTSVGRIKLRLPWLVDLVRIDLPVHRWTDCLARQFVLVPQWSSSRRGLVYNTLQRGAFQQCLRVTRGQALLGQCCALVSQLCDGSFAQGHDVAAMVPVAARQYACQQPSLFWHRSLAHGRIRPVCRGQGLFRYNSSSLCGLLGR